jgi:hypothetical protein
MRRAVKVLLWVAVFAACFGVGAYVAAHTDPFPPGVEDPGARSDPGATPSGSAPSGSMGAGRWPVEIGVRTSHDLYVGGRCAGSWRIEVELEVDGSGLTGTATATLQGELRCDEPTAQVQADRVELVASGSSADGALRFRLAVTSRSPLGSQDLSGLVKTVPTLRFRLPAREGATASFDIAVPDGDRGTYGAVGQVVVSGDPTTG